MENDVSQRNVLHLHHFFCLNCTREKKKNTNLMWNNVIAFFLLLRVNQLSVFI